MDWWAPIDIYCERTAVGYWNEPLNALSNLAFILAALVAIIAARKSGPQPPRVWVLIALTAAVGVGSYAFHTHANAVAELADVIPIWSFVALYVVTSIELIGGVKISNTLKLGIFSGAAAVITLMAMPEGQPHDHGPAAPSLLNGSEQYAPALAALLIFAVITRRRAHPIAPWILAATATFALALVFRTIDIALCGPLPHGTHFLWHSLNGLMMGLLLVALIRHQRPRIPAKT